MPPGDADWNMLRVLQKLDQGLKLTTDKTQKRPVGAHRAQHAMDRALKCSTLDLPSNSRAQMTVVGQAIIFA